MKNVLFDLETRCVAGKNREPLPYEFAVEGVDAELLTKVLPVPGRAPKTDADGNAVYLLPVEDEEVTRDIETPIITTEDTGNPVLHTITWNEPMLDEDGKQMRYEVMNEVVTPATFDEEGNELTEETREMVPTGVFRDIFTVEELDEQKTDEDGKPLFHGVHVEQVTETVTSEPIEITEDDDRFEEGLEQASVDVTNQRLARFTEEPEAFTFEDVVRFKEASLVKGTLFGSASHFEGFEDSLFSLHLVDAGAHVGFQAFSLPPGASVRTEKLDLPKKSNMVFVRTEASQPGITLKAGTLADSLEAVNARGEALFDGNAEAVYVQFHNPTDRTIDVRSFSLLV